MIEALASHFGNLIFVLEHLGYLTAQDLSCPKMKQKWRRLIGLAARENVYLGCSAWGYLLEDSYPGHLSLQFLKEAADAVGSEKLLWGSDVPSTLNLYTYRQMLDVVRVHADFLSDKQKDDILWRNAAKLLSW